MPSTNRDLCIMWILHISFHLDRVGIDWFGNRQKNELALKSLKTGDCEELVFPAMPAEKITREKKIFTQTKKL